jgi:dipeptidyl-peptidase 4
MKKWILFLGIVLGLVFGKLNAQIIDLEGVFTGKYRMDDLQNLSWRPTTNQYVYVKNDTIYCVDATTSKIKEIITLHQINNKISGKPLKRIPYFSWIDKDLLYLPATNEIISVSFAGVLNGVPIPENLIDQSLKYKLFVVEEEGNIYVKSEKNQYKSMLLCPDTGKNIVFGKTVHRSEWGIGEGQYISPKGNYIAFYRMDESMVADYPLVDVSGDLAIEKPIKYPMAGKKSHQVKVGIFDVIASITSGTTVYHYIETDLNDGEFLTNVTFSPDEKYLYITHLNRAQNDALLIRYDVKTGQKDKILIEEKDNRYVEPTTRPYFLTQYPFFIWQSDRDGWNHLYLYSDDGKLITQLTKGYWQVNEFYGMDPKEENLYFASSNPTPTGNFIYTLGLKNKKMKPIAVSEGTHSPLFSDDKSFCLDYFTNIETPKTISLINTKDLNTKVLLTATNPYLSANLGESKIFTIKNDHGDDLYCRITYPPQFDPNKKYPVLMYVYGGPHSQMVTNTFLSGGVFLQYMAQKGFIVFSLDNRGTAKRGSAFEKCIHRQLGKFEMEDQMKGVAYLKSLNYVDSKNISLDGWSYGGFMIMSLITTYPDQFSTATCGGPVIDWSWYEIMYGERYMDTPEENPEGYAAAEILPKVKNITSNLLVFHGCQDDTVLWQQSLKLINQAIKDGIIMDYFVYPNYPHNVRGKDRVHLWKMIENYHIKNLK